MFEPEEIVCCGIPPRRNKRALLIAVRHIDQASSFEQVRCVQESHFPAMQAMEYGSSPLGIWVTRPWTLRNKLSVLRDWATALKAQHANNVVHGNLTPESVDVVDGKGALLDRGSSFEGLQGLDDDVYGARWAATELFRPDDGNIHPTKMSDVYSFACLMLQMLTGSVPYCGTKRPEQVVYLKYLGREPIDSETPKIEDHYVVFMRRCWSPEPEKRPTMEDVVGFICEEILKIREDIVKLEVNATGIPCRSI